MITQQQVMPLLLDACPSFRTRWQEYVRGPVYEEELLFVHLGELAVHLVALKEKQQIEEFPVVFAVVEALHLDGDDYVRSAAAVGLLEGIQNVASHGELDAEVFVPHLLPETLRWWRKLNRFWNGDIKALTE